ncbi:MAG: aldehyde dehydrogenase family protein [Clostridiales Family XIII bacterium]|nr:aldehyde dehydrogenase family protein [Clostridiales Family XIII bacterium]
MNIIDNDLLSVQEARILAENAQAAQKVLSWSEQELLDGIVDSVFSAIHPEIESLADLAFEETDYGRAEDKRIKIRFICERLKAAMDGMRCVGILGCDREKRLMDVGVPIGPLAAFCPVTNPVSTTIYKALIAIKSGNAIVFSPHPRAKNCMTRTLEIIVNTAESAGLPKGGVSFLSNVTAAGSVELINHANIALIINTGVPGLFSAIAASGKHSIIGGMGNGPAFIERTADIRRAVNDIVMSKTFDYGVVSAAEQSVVVDSPIEAEVRREFERRGAYFMTPGESEALGSLFYDARGRANPGVVGISAERLAKKAGFIVPYGVKVLISEQGYVSGAAPYSKEKLCPVLAWYVESDWMGACEKCIELLLSERQGHTLVIHSMDEDVIRQFALKKPVGRLLVNTPGVFGGMGVTTELFPAMTLGGASARAGITAENVSPMNLVYIRKIGYGVRDVDSVVARLSSVDAEDAASIGARLSSGDVGDTASVGARLSSPGAGLSPSASWDAAAVTASVNKFDMPLGYGSSSEQNEILAALKKMVGTG